jgi:hypothetical protein
MIFTDLGKKTTSKGKGELFINATDVLNTMITTEKEIIIRF